MITASRHKILVKNSYNMKGNTMLRNFISVAVVSTVTAENKTPFTVVQENSTHLRISWKTGLNNNSPLYILSNGSQILITDINSSNDTQTKRNEELYLELNPCLNHSLCAGDETTCFSINTTTPCVPENQANLLKNQTQRTNQTLTGWHNVWGYR